MKNTFDKFVAFVLDRRWWIIILLAILTLAGAVSVALNLRINNAVSIWFLEDNADYQKYLSFQQDRGSDEIIIAMIPAEESYAPETIDLLQRLHVAVDSLPDVTATFSLANARYPVYSNRKLYYRPVYQDGRSPEQLDRLLNELPAVKKQLVNLDRQAVFFYAQLDPTDQIESRRNEIVESVRTVFDEVIPQAIVSGQPILNEAFNASIYEESNFFAVATIAVILILLLFLLPHWQYVPIALISIAVPVSVLMGSMTAMGYSLNLISMLIPTILMVYSVSDAVHVINIFHREANAAPALDRAAQISLALQKSWKPCWYTTLTTIVGYLALYLSPLPAFKVMGVFTFCGMLLAFFLVYVICTIGFSFLTDLKQQHSVPKINVAKLVERINYWTTHRSRIILLLAAIAFGLGLFSLSRLEVNTDSLHLLGEGSAKTDLFAIEDALGGNARFQINISRTDGETFLQETELDRLADFQAQIDSLEQLATPVSIINFRTFLEKRTTQLSVFSQVRLPEVIQNQPEQANSFFSLFADDFGEVNIAVNVKELETKQLEELLSEIEVAFRQSFPEERYQLDVHGFLALFAQLNQFILQTQFRSFGLAFLVAFVILVYFIGDWKISILALLPNLLPLTLTISLMVLLGIDLEAANAMLAPIMLGVAMDDTIHLMNKFQVYRKAGDDTVAAMDKALQYTGGALLSTTIALVCGFLVVGFSGVVSVSTFGLLCAFTVLTALLADVVVLPAMMKRWVD
ncbi:MAG: MMPL family transporter [Bacteroidota bacterium]